MDIAKQIIDQRVNKILEDNPEIFQNTDEERRRSKAFLLLGVIRVAAFYYQSTGNMIKSSWLIYGDSFLALPICEKNDFPYQYEF